MDLNNIKNQAMNKVREASHNEKLTDSVLDKASQAAKKVTGGKYDDKIDQARDRIKILAQLSWASIFMPSLRAAGALGAPCRSRRQP